MPNYKTLLRVSSPPREKKIEVKTRHTLYNVQLGIELKRLRSVGGYKSLSSARAIAVECAIQLAISERQYFKYETGEAPVTVAQLIDIVRILRKHVKPEVFATSDLKSFADLPIK